MEININSPQYYTNEFGIDDEIEKALFKKQKNTLKTNVTAKVLI